jgi:hypothetical protein
MGHTIKVVNVNDGDELDYAEWMFGTHCPAATVTREKGIGANDDTLEVTGWRPGVTVHYVVNIDEVQTHTPYDGQPIQVTVMDMREGGAGMVNRYIGQMRRCPCGSRTTMVTLDDVPVCGQCIRRRGSARQ